MDRFEVKSITLSNFRRFQNTTFQLNPQMNVFVGKNSSGKTTVLEAVCVIMGAYLAAYKEYVSSNHVFNISSNDILLKNNFDNSYKGFVAPTEAKQFPCSISCELLWDNSVISFQRKIEKVGGRTKFDGKNPMQSKVLSWEYAIKQADNSDKELIFPITLYLSSARLWNENNTGKSMSKIPSRMDAYQRCLDKKRGNQLAFDYIKLLRDLAAEENEGEQFPAYKAILQAVNYSMYDELKEGQELVYSSRYHDFALKNTDSTIIKFSELSDGYRNVIKIVTDIATRMCILNPYLGADALKKTPGVVIIDELDLSLHPTWQKRIVRILKNLFPKVQFICATHSPFIIQSLDEGELIVLDEATGDEEYSGQSIEDIAETIMGVDIPQYSEKKEEMLKAAKEYFLALNDKNISPDKLMELKEKADILEAEYSDNPAYGAYIQLKYKEKIIEIEG